MRAAGEHYNAGCCIKQGRKPARGRPARGLVKSVGGGAQAWTSPPACLRVALHSKEHLLLLALLLGLLCHGHHRAQAWRGQGPMVKSEWRQAVAAAAAAGHQCAAHRLLRQMQWCPGAPNHCQSAGRALSPRLPAARSPLICWSALAGLAARERPDRRPVRAARPAAAGASTAEAMLRTRVAGVCAARPLALPTICTELQQCPEQLHRPGWSG